MNQGVVNVKVKAAAKEGKAMELAEERIEERRITNPWQ